MHRRSPIVFRFCMSSTEKNNNTSPTAASAGTDLNGTAAVMACQQIRERMAELAARMFSPSEEYSPSVSPSDIVNSGTHTFNSDITTGNGASPSVLSALAADSDGDGDVDGQDYSRFGRQLMRSLPF